MEQKKRIEVKIKSYDLPPDVSADTPRPTVKPTPRAVQVSQSVKNDSQQQAAPKKKFVVTIKEDEDEISEILQESAATDAEKKNAAKPARKPYELDDTVTRIIKETDAIKRDKNDAGETENDKNGEAEQAAVSTQLLTENSAKTPAHNVPERTAVKKTDAKNEKPGKKSKSKAKKKKYEPQNPVARFLKKFIPWGGDSAFEIIRKMILIIAVIVAIACVYIIVEYQKSTQDSEAKNQSLADMHEQLTQEDDKTDESSAVDPDILLDDDYVPPMLRSQEYFYDLNNDVIGWIQIENTHIDLPVLQADDNDYYLNKDIYGEHDDYGCIYADYRCTLTHNQRSDNLVIYGHDTKTNSMFGDLDQYKTNFGTINYLREHPVIKLNSNYYEYEYVIFAVFITNTDEASGEVWGYQNEIEFTDELDFQTYVSNCKKRSMYDTYIDVEYGEKMVTLSTCATDFEDSRLVVVARELREGETGYDYVDDYEYNDNPLYPDIWYRYRGGSYDDTDTRYDIETLFGELSE